MTTYDVAIIGGGPAGCATGLYLAQAGLRVVIVEGDRHPRHHIGESLLPDSIGILNELGISSDELAKRWQTKFGARFYDTEQDRLATFGFEPTEGSISPAYQVLRQEFDALIWEKASLAGCDTWQNAAVESCDEHSPRINLKDGRELTAGFLVDATGREAFIARKNKWKRTIPDYGRVAVYNYFADLPPHDHEDPKYITMYVFEGCGGGWVWLIPLRDGRTSLGVVYRKPPELPQTTSTREESLFWEAVKGMPRLELRLRAARPTEPYRAAGDYSFTVDHKMGPTGTAPGGLRWAAVGDAAGFLDPIFSSGMHLAITRILAGRVWDADNPVVRMVRA
jgi:flavin-dependent dehydrogenase